MTANRHVLGHPGVAAIAGRRGWSPAQVIFRFALDTGMVPLTGTTDPAHMRDDLAVVAAPPLEPDERDRVDHILARR